MQDDLQRLVGLMFIEGDDNSWRKVRVESSNFCVEVFDETEVNHSGNHIRRSMYDKDNHQMVFALTQNALNSTVVKRSEHGNGWGDGLFPRNTQFIRLSETADLVGGLMDFDLSIVGCAYDGNGVYVTPRAAYSLVTLSQIVTPFILEEKRNWRRILKVSQSEVDAFLLKSSCLLSNTERVSNLWSPFFSTTREVSSHM